VGGYVIRGDYQTLLERHSAIVLRLQNTEPLLVRSAQRLSELVQEFAPGSSLSTGLLKQAFRYYRLYKTTTGQAVGIGDPSILTKPQPAGHGYIRDFVEWLRGVNQRQWTRFKSRLQAASRQRRQLTRMIQAEKARIRTRMKRIAAAARAMRARKKLAMAKKEAALQRIQRIRSMVREILIRPAFSSERVLAERIQEIRTRIGYTRRAEVSAALRYNRRVGIPSRDFGFKTWKGAETYVHRVFSLARRKR